MKTFTICTCAICLLWMACNKSTQVNPVKTSTTSTTNQSSTSSNNNGNSRGQAIVAPQDTVDQVGTWKWVAQYDLGSEQGDLLTPASTGIQETLSLDANHNWVQMQNGVTVNSGKYQFPQVATPAGIIMIFMKLINQSSPNTQLTDNFNFGTGFLSSYTLSKDTLVFYGIGGPTGNMATQRVYVK